MSQKRMNGTARKDSASIATNLDTFPEMPEEEWSCWKD